MCCSRPARSLHKEHFMAALIIEMGNKKDHCCKLIKGNSVSVCVYVQKCAPETLRFIAFSFRELMTVVTGN